MRSFLRNGAGLWGELKEAILKLLEKENIEPPWVKSLEKRITTSFRVEVDGLRKELRNEVDTLRNEVGGLRNEVGGLRNEVGVLRHEVGGLRNEVGVLRNEVGDVCNRLSVFEGRVFQQLGLLCEESLRQKAAQKWGQKYMNTLVAKSIVDLLELFPDAYIADRSSLLGRNRTLQITRVAEITTRNMVDQRVIMNMLENFNRIALMKNDAKEYSLNWFEDGKINMVEFGKFLNQIKAKNVSLHKSFLLLKEAVHEKTTLQQEEMLLSDSGTSMMCINFLALPKWKVDENARVAEIVLPASELEFDMKGDITVGGYNGRKQIVIDIGEAKLSADYGGAIVQLGERIQILKMLVRLLEGSTEYIDFVSIGRLLLFRTMNKKRDIPVSEIRRAWNTYEFMFQVEIV